MKEKFKSGVTVAEDEKEDIHIMPSGGDLVVHTESELCECRPVWNEENKKDFLAGRSGQKVFVHRRVKDELN